MTFQGADKLLEENILKQPLLFFRTWAEWATENSTRQFIEKVSRFGAGSIVILTVPENQTFFLTSAMISLSAGTSSSTLFLGIPQFTDAEILQITVFSGRTDSISLSFPMPLKINQGEQLRITNTGALSTATACVQGFFVSKRISGRS